MGACTECRKAKVKCEHQEGVVCARCQRLGKDCVPHQSRQGQKPGSSNGSISGKRSRSGSSIKSEIDDCDDDDAPKSPRHKLAAAAAASTQKGEDGAILQEAAAIPPCRQQYHYGLHHLVRQWVALAFRRRSFSLLARAGKLALISGIHMDDILCELENNNSSKTQQRGMDFLYPILLTPANDQRVVAEPLGLDDIPVSLLQTVGLIPSTHGSKQPKQRKIDAARTPTFLMPESILHNRWFYSRAIKKGISRFYCSPSWEQHVVTRQEMEEAYRQNKMEVADLFLVDTGPKSKQDFAKMFTHQVSLHVKAGMNPKPTRQCNVQIKVRGFPESIMKMDQIWGMSLANHDQTFVLTEFIPSSERRLSGTLERNESLATFISEQQSASLEDAKNSLLDDEVDVDDLFIDFDTISMAHDNAGADDEMKLLLDLLNEGD